MGHQGRGHEKVIEKTSPKTLHTISEVVSINRESSHFREAVNYRSVIALGDLILVVHQILPQPNQHA
jgi:hypothetical protein